MTDEFPPVNNLMILLPNGSSESSGSTSTSASDSLSGYTSNTQGRALLDISLSSVLSHRLGLPLLYALHGKDPSLLKYLGRTRRSMCLSEEKDLLNCIFKDAINDWKGGNVRTKSYLTKLLVLKIAGHNRSVQNKAQNASGSILEQHLFVNALHEVKVEESGVPDGPDGHVDIVCSEANSTEGQFKSTPLAVIKLGLKGNNWWKELDKGVMHIDRMQKKPQNLPFLQFEKRLLLGVITYDDESCEGEECHFRIGIFLCSPKSRNSRHCCMSLLWRTEANNLENASNMFGRFLGVIADFQLWRDIQEQPDDGYEYFGSHCCKAVSSNNNNEVVLRSYDSRVCTTNRSPDVYLDPVCSDIVGTVEKILELPSTDAIVASKSNDFWDESKDRVLLVIAAPFRRGNHVVKQPSDFIPIIDQLMNLHKKGYVHGDIRAFNTVFGEEGQGYLIDFDYGGKIGSKYPKGYCQSLEDGRRIGNGDNDDGTKNEILKWHDWYALGNLMFDVHVVDLESYVPEDSERPESKEFLKLVLSWYKLDRFWRQEINDVPTDDQIHQLKEYLSHPGFAIKPNQIFRSKLEKMYRLTDTN